MSLGLGLGLDVRRGGPSLIDQVVALFQGGSVEGQMIIVHPDNCFQDRSTSPSTSAGVGDPVGTILDLSGNANPLIAPSDAARPTLRDAGGGFYQVEFDGTNHALVSNASYDLGAESTHVVGVQKVSGTSIQRVIGDAGGAVKHLVTYDGSGLAFGVNNTTADSGYIRISGSNSNDQEVYSIIRSQTDDHAEIFLNGASAVTGDHDQSSVSSMQPVMGGWGATGQFNRSAFKCSGFVYIDTELSASDRSLVESLYPQE